MKSFFTGFVTGAGVIIIVGSQVWILVVTAFESLLIVLTVTACILTVAYSIGRIRVWAIRTGGYSTQFVTQSYEQPNPHLEGQEILQPDTDSKEQWRSAVIRYALVGHLHGFGANTMLHYMERSAWDRLTALLVQASVLELGRGRRATQWAAGWDLGRLRFELRTGGLALPYPAETPPVISW
jgi:hypothetical protein